MGYNWQTCYSNLTAQGLNPCDGNVSLPLHCTDFQVTAAYHATCNNSTSMYTPVQAIVCKNSAGTIQVFPTDQLISGCSNLALSQPSAGWALYNCYCCCSCFANGTMIAVPNGNSEIQTLLVGEPVLTGSWDPTKKLTWKPTPVSFSNGTGAGKDNVQPGMIYIFYGDQKEIIVSTDQVMMLASGKLTTAMKLIPGDKLMAPDGSAVEVITVSLGEYAGGVHHIATTNGFDKTPNNHLIIANGLVCGDYTLQLYFDGLDPQYKDPQYDNLATIGSKAYSKRTARLSSANTHMSTTLDADQIHMLKNDRFSVYRIIGDNLPYGAAALWTPAQAEDIMTNGTQFPIVSKIGLATAQYVIDLLKGFYPEYNIYLAWNQMEPNVYAFEEYGIKTVLVTGGLARMQGLLWQGLAMLVGDGIARFEGNGPKNMMGFICTGYADFYAFAAVSRKIWYQGQFLPNTEAAYNQVATLFNLITPANAGGDPNNVCGDPSVACRLSAMQSGFAGGNVPVCAGGQPMPSVQLQLATATATQVTLTLSTGVTSKSASVLANYTFSTGAKATKATLDPNMDFVIHIDGAFVPGATYTVTIANLVSIYGTGVDPQHNSAQFTVPGLTKATTGAVKTKKK